MVKNKFFVNVIKNGFWVKIQRNIFRLFVFCRLKMTVQNKYYNTCGKYYKYPDNNLKN